MGLPAGKDAGLPEVKPWLVREDGEALDDEVVVLALGEAGDGDAADDAGAGDMDGEAAAVGSVVRIGQGVLLSEGGLVLLQVEA